MAQRFYNLVLLPRVRDDIAEYKRLNFHLYMALKKALFKPGAWFKGKSAEAGEKGGAWSSCAGDWLYPISHCWSLVTGAAGCCFISLTAD